MMDGLSDQNRIWLDQFIGTYGRKPSVLMIGNIANNAYNNAKILNQAGFDCDVICYDYYHVMACPEWEDADLHLAPDDAFRPDWTCVPMGSFNRPRWFAQGRLTDCIDYLITRRVGGIDTESKWRKLVIRALVVCGVGLKDRLDSTQFRAAAWFWRYTIRLRLWASYRAPSFYSKLKLLKRLVNCILRPLVNAVAQPQGAPKYLATDSPTVLFENRSRELVQRFAHEFPDRNDQLLKSDFDQYASTFNEWTKLLKLYDIVIGFSTDPFVPLLCDKPYFAVEHGTLRNIPFASDGQGRRTALAYRLAQHCFVTNFDCADNAAYLAPGRYTLINHPYDEDHGLSVDGAEELRSQLRRELDADFLFFHPTRQDWVEGTGYADKSNDVFLQSFAALRKRGLKVGAVICSWGSNVQQSRELLSTLECSRHAHWTPPLAITPFERMCKACDTVVDQFKLGAFGGVVFKAMAVGTPIITFLNEDLIIHQYPEVPPVINCRTVDDIEKAVMALMLEPDELRQLGCRSRDWICRHHGKRETLNKQVDQFRRHLPIPYDRVSAFAP